MVSGLVGASTGLAGIPVIVWSTVRGWSKDEQRAVFQPVVVAVFAMTLIWFGGSGMLSADWRHRSVRRQSDHLAALEFCGGPNCRQ